MLDKAPLAHTDRRGRSGGGLDGGGGGDNGARTILRGSVAVAPVRGAVAPVWGPGAVAPVRLRRAAIGQQAP